MMCWVCAVVLVLLRSCRILTINGFTISQIYVEYVLNWFNDYIPLASTWLILTHFESSSCHGFTLHIVILCNTTMLKWTHTVPHTFWAHLMVCQPKTRALKCHWGNVANPKPLRLRRFVALPCNCATFQKFLKKLSKNIQEQVVNLSTIWRLNLWLSLIAPFSRLQCLCQLRPYSLLHIIQLEFRRCR